MSKTNDESFSDNDTLSSKEYNSDDDVFIRRHAIEKFSYPDVYPCSCEEDKLLYYADNFFSEDKFISKLARLHRLQKITIIDEQIKNNKNDDSSTFSRRNSKKADTTTLSTKPKKHFSTSTLSKKISKDKKSKNVYHNDARENFTDNRNHPLKSRETGLVNPQPRRIYARELNTEHVNNEMDNKLFISPFNKKMMEVQSEKRPTTYKIKKTVYKKYIEDHIKEYNHFIVKEKHKNWNKKALSKKHSNNSYKDNLVKPAKTVAQSMVTLTARSNEIQKGKEDDIAYKKSMLNHNDECEKTKILINSKFPGEGLTNVTNSVKKNNENTNSTNGNSLFTTDTHRSTKQYMSLSK